jgi:hypothetical protein
MDDHAASLLQHPGEQRAIEANGGEQVDVECLLPVLVAEGEDAAARRARTPDVVD